MSSDPARFRWLGRLDYLEADRLQREAHQRVRLSAGAATFEILGLEHNPVITLGVRGSETDDLQLPREGLAVEGWDVVKTDRGGQATLHEPGQLVIYPIVPLSRMKLGVREFVELLLSASAETLQRYGVETRMKLEPTGLYCGSGKILFCGLRIDRGISRHGISINLWNDPGHFSRIRACGISSGAITNVERETGVRLNSSEFFQDWSDTFNASLNALLQEPLQEKPVSSLSWAHGAVGSAFP